MSTAYAVRDSATMLRRNLLHIRRYPSLSIMLVAQPILFLLLFVYVFGGTMAAGLPGHEGAGDRSDYLVYIAPGILIMTVASVALGTAISTATDMTTGIIARFRTMDIARVSVLTGHVLKDPDAIDKSNIIEIEPTIAAVERVVSSSQRP